MIRNLALTSGHNQEYISYGMYSFFHYEVVEDDLPESMLIHEGSIEELEDYMAENHLIFEDENYDW